MKLRLLAIGIAVFLFANGLALGIVGIVALSRSALVGITAVAIAVALVTYAIAILLRARRGQLPNWIRDLPHSAPL